MEIHTDTDTHTHTHRHTEIQTEVETDRQTYLGPVGGIFMLTICAKIWHVDDNMPLSLIDHTVIKCFGT